MYGNDTTFLVHGKSCGLIRVDTSCSFSDMVEMQMSLDRMTGAKRSDAEIHDAATYAQMSRISRAFKDATRM